MPDIVAGVIAIGFLVLWIYAIYDVITTDEVIMRHLPKMVWLIIVLLIPDIGSLLWLGLGRPRVWEKQSHDPDRYGTPRRRTYAGQHEAIDAPASPRTTRNPRAPRLDDEALDRMNPLVRHREEQARLRLWEEQLKRREDEIRRRELEGGSSPSI